MEVTADLLEALGFKKDVWHEERERFVYRYTPPNCYRAVVVTDTDLEEGEYENIAEVLEMILQQVYYDVKQQTKHAVLEVLNG